MADFTQMWRDLEARIKQWVLAEFAARGLEQRWLVGSNVRGPLPNATIAHSATTGQTADDHHDEDHAARHAADGADPLDAADLGSGAAEAGQVPTADGAGGIDWADQTSTPDAADVTYTPAVPADWDGDADPGNVDDALDQLAERVDDLENVAPGATQYFYVNFIIDGGGSAITTGVKGDVQVPAGTIVAAEIVADQTGDCVVDIWRDTYANHPPTDADSITASAPPTLSSAAKAQDSTLTGWTTSLSEGDWLRFNVDSAATCERVTVSLKVQR